MIKKNNFLLLIFTGILFSCHSKIKERNEEIYSRHLQKHISLTIISTPPPKNKSDFNLLLLNNGQDMQREGIKEILDSLHRKKLINPIIIVGTKAFDPRQEYGVAGFTDRKNNGKLASKYGAFIVNELLPFIKTKSGVRSFRSVSIAGSGMAGISAIDIAWNNWQKFDRVGFLPEFDNSHAGMDFSNLSEMISKSRKRPKIQFWLDQKDYMENSQTDDSTSMQHLLDVLKMKGQEQSLTIVGIESDRDRNIPFKDSFTQFLFWLNEK